MDRFKKEYTFEQRKDDTDKVMQKYKNRVPVYLYKGKFNRTMEEYEKKKFLVSEDMKFYVFTDTIRNTYKIDKNQSIYYMINDKVMIEMTSTLGMLYRRYKDDDGYLYLSYYGENVFGI